MKNLMLDLETLSTKPNAAIIAIAAIVFDARGLSFGFYQNVIASSNGEHHAHFCNETQAWWDKQPQEAKSRLQENRVTLKEALKRFVEYSKYLDFKNTLIWGNGANFDPVVIRSAFERVGIECPWPYYNERCFRTKREEYPHIKADEFVGIKHFALDDAHNQAMHFNKIESLKLLRGPSDEE